MPASRPPYSPLLLFKRPFVPTYSSYYGSSRVVHMTHCSLYRDCSPVLWAQDCSGGGQPCGSRERKGGKHVPLSHRRKLFSRGLGRDHFVGCDFRSSVTPVPRRAVVRLNYRLSGRNSIMSASGGLVVVCVDQPTRWVSGFHDLFLLCVCVFCNKETPRKCSIAGGVDHRELYRTPCFQWSGW